MGNVVVASNRLPVCKKVNGKLFSQEHGRCGYWAYDVHENPRNRWIWLAGHRQR